MREGDFWLVIFEGQAVHLRDQKGLHYLARLLAEPGREFHVVDLVIGGRTAPGRATRATEHDLWVPGRMDAGQVLDAQAKESYRRRLVEIEADIEDARELGGFGTRRTGGYRREFIVCELARAVGLGGRNRRASSSSERARVSVTQAIRQAMARIHDDHVPLGEHLDRTIRTGTYCTYLPDPRVPGVWKV
jgi:hypothetical protein